MKTVSPFVLEVFLTANQGEDGNVGMLELVAFTVPAEDNSSQEWVGPAP